MGLYSFILSLTGCSTNVDTTVSAEQTRFDWEASESAPEHYPMQIISGNFRYYGDANGAGLYAPSGNTLYNGWGLKNSVHVTGEVLKPLPDKLDITFFSYLEDQFYRGSFDLPYNTILRLFQEEEKKPKQKSMNGTDISNNYMIIVGVAPGGVVAVWMRGQGTKEILFGKAQKIDLDFTKTMGYPEAKRAEFLKEIIEFAVNPDILAAIRKNGIPFQKWENYRARYNWVPSFTVNNPPEKISISFYTGEGQSFAYPLEKDFTTKTHPALKSIRFTYTKSGQTKSNYYYIRFDEDEILDAFTRLNTKESPLKVEFDPKLPIEQTQIRLHNGKDAIQLKKFTIKRK